MSPPDVSVVIPTRNRLQLLQASTHTVLRQIGVSVECIVIDDASDDGTTDWLQSVTDERLSFKRLESNAERSAARNAGLHLATGEYILFLDDDDLLTRTAL